MSFLGKACVLGMTAFTVAGLAQATNDLFPPNAKPGQCYARVFVPASYETRTETMLRHDSYHKLQIVPAKFGMAEERVLIKEASERLEVVPATYGWEEERVMTKPASKKVVNVPAMPRLAAGQ